MEVDLTSASRSNLATVLMASTGEADGNAPTCADAMYTAVLPPTAAIGYLWSHRVCPAISEDGLYWLLAAPDANLEDSQPELSEAIGHRLEVKRLSWESVRSVLECIPLESHWEHDGASIEGESADLRDIASQPPVIRFVSSLIAKALKLRASDIHIEAGLGGAAVRFRVDGTLEAGEAPPEQLHAAVVSRIKLLGDLDIAEHRVPQDGRIRVRLENRDLDLRVSTLPTMHGESVVLRLLESAGRPGDLSRLGMPDDLQDEFLAQLRKPNGLTIVTGPTGSGKTTTLYAALNQRDLSREKVITLEDPIEYRLPGVVQVPVRSSVGVTIASALRTVLRQDPDVIMVGEMRDAETAGLSVQAALTGHLVLSTLHTIDAFTAIPRLTDLGVPAYLVAATLDAVLAQRLVRRNCPSCASPASATMSAVNIAHGAWPPHYLRGIGCAECRGTGYRGRLGIYELLVSMATENATRPGN
ncbi:MAG: GspE/PulE family protein [Gemmatimonadaceae bacterium]|nr:GspE/PulE family protein [Gemmatimonadaceae bacterium]